VQLDLHKVFQDVGVITRVKGVAVAEHGVEIPKESEAARRTASGQYPPLSRTSGWGRKKTEKAAPGGAAF
jgi:hypothetical protein